jgi:hypothetical protein
MSALLSAALATLVFCAPGYPGVAGDAQPLLDQFVSSVVATAGWPSRSLAGIYDPTEDGGLTKLSGPDAVLAFVPYPFFVEHATQLHLMPLAQANVANIGTQQRWSLIAKKGRITGPGSLANTTILSVAGYAPDFVRHVALQGWEPPANAKIESTAQILSALRRAAAGEPIAALLDQTQATALPSLPFASELEVVRESAQLPVAVIAVVNSRIPAARARALQQALLTMAHAAGGADALQVLQLTGFVSPQLPPYTATP